MSGLLRCNAPRNDNLRHYEGVKRLWQSSPFFIADNDKPMSMPELFHRNDFLFSL